MRGDERYLFFDRITSNFPMGKWDPQIFFSSQEAFLVSANIRGLTSPEVSSRNRYDQYSVTILQVYLKLGCDNEKLTSI